MGIQSRAENTIIVDLAPEPRIRDELDTVIEIIREGGGCDVVIDFSRVDIVSSLSLSGFLQLRKLLNDCGHRLIFCSVAPMTQKIFNVTCLNGNFEFVSDKATALETIQNAK